MNYRHGFHAGNFADLPKHLALCELLRLLTAKDKKLFVLDTHAGTGGYDLAGSFAQRAREAESGVSRLMSAPRAGMPAARSGTIQAHRGCCVPPCARATDWWLANCIRKTLWR